MQHWRNLIVITQEHLCQPRALRRATAGTVLMMNHWLPEAKYEGKGEVVLE